LSKSIFRAHEINAHVENGGSITLFLFSSFCSFFGEQAIITTTTTEQKKKREIDKKACGKGKEQASLQVSK
jgi:hypothetical protein